MHVGVPLITYSSLSGKIKLKYPSVLSVTNLILFPEATNAVSAESSMTTSGISENLLKAMTSVDSLVMSTRL